MIGVVLNALGLVAGGLFGLARKEPLSARLQAQLKFYIGAAAVLLGLRSVWVHLHGGVLACLKQMAVVLLAMILGRLVGRLLRLQKLSNAIGQHANGRLAHVLAPGAQPTFSDGLVICAILACANPLSVLGAVEEGLYGTCFYLALKAALDGLVALSFVRLLGAGVWAALLPVVAWQGTLFMLVRLAQPWLLERQLGDVVGVTGGLLVFCLSLIIWNLKKVELADYLPSLALAPLLAWWWL